MKRFCAAYVSRTGRSVRRAYQRPAPPTARIARPSMTISCRRSRVTDWLTRSCSVSCLVVVFAIAFCRSVEMLR